jgi:hypothetical protein
VTDAIFFPGHENVIGAEPIKLPSPAGGRRAGDEGDWATHMSNKKHSKQQKYRRFCI